MKTGLTMLLLTLVFPCLTGAESSRPNIILMMADDQGWGDTGYNGHPHLKTPHLDQMAAEGITFTRFYAANAMCSPTRASVYTGRHPYRTGITFAMKGMLEPEEITITRILKKAGYATGHFGKWHMGTLSPKKPDQNRWGAFKDDPERYYCPPWERDVDVSFVTESRYCSDNGPARQGSPRHVGSTKGLSGFKLSLREGGIRVPGILVWPARYPKPKTITTPCVTTDYFPTILAALDIPLPDGRPYDDMNIRPLIDNPTRTRTQPIGFIHNGRVWMDYKYKLISKGEEAFRLYDIVADPEEKHDLAGKLPAVLRRMKAEFEPWYQGVMADLERVESR